MNTNEIKTREAHKAFALMSAGRSFSYLDDLVERYNVKQKRSSWQEKLLKNMTVYNLVLDDYNYLKKDYPTQALFMSLKRFANYCVDKYYEEKE